MAEEGKGTNISPLLYLGILLFVIPVILGIVRYDMPLKGFVTGLGILLIIVGAVHSAISN